MGRTNYEVGFSTNSASTCAYEGFDYNMKNEFAVITDEPGMCQTKNIGSASNLTLPEVVTYRCYTEDKVSSGVKGMYAPSTKQGFKIAVNDNFIVRSNWADGSVTDDPVKIAVSFETTNGSPLADSHALLPYLARAFKLFIGDNADHEGGEADKAPGIDRLIKSAVKPAELV